MSTNAKGSVVVYTDGGARGNPGPAGAGAVVYGKDGSQLKTISVYLGEQTNNWAEYEAVYLGLTALKKLFGKNELKTMPVEVRLDSELIAKQLNNEYQVKEESLFPQFIKVHNLLVKDIQNVSFNHVRREKNKDADRLANEAMDSGT